MAAAALVAAVGMRNRKRIARLEADPFTLKRSLFRTGASPVDCLKARSAPTVNRLVLSKPACKRWRDLPILPDISGSTDGTAVPWTTRGQAHPAASGQASEVVFSEPATRQSFTKNNNLVVPPVPLSMVMSELSARVIQFRQRPGRAQSRLGHDTASTCVSPPDRPSSHEHRSSLGAVE
jgi:hypothetical protein